MTTIHRIAHAAGVSSSTVSRVLSGQAKANRISKTTATRVRAVAEKLGYQPNQHARSLRTRRTQSVGFLATDLANPFFATIAGTVEAFASEAGYTTIVATSAENPERELECLRILSSRPTDGLIVTPTSGRIVKRALMKLAHRKFPLVVIDRLVSGLECDYVLAENRRGAASLAAALARFGCRRVAYVGGPRGVWTAEERLAGFREGLTRVGLQLSRALTFTGSYTVEHGHSAMRAMLTRKTLPDGIACANNRILVGVLEVLAGAGDRTNKIAIASFDGVPFASLLGRPIVIAEQPEEEIGRTAARLLIERIEGHSGQPRRIMLPVTIRTYPCRGGAYQKED